MTYGDTAFVNAEANQAAEESQPAEESKPADETSGAYSVNGDAEETAADVEAEYTAAGSAENYFAQANWNAPAAGMRAWRRCSPCWAAATGQRTNW